MTELIYCAAKNKQYAALAIARGFTYGARLPASVYFAPAFVDQEWRNLDRAAYMKAIQQYRPRLATVLDWEREEQLPDVLAWADEAARYVSEAVIIIPKVIGGIPRLPRTIRGKQVRLGYSVPTSYAGTGVPKREFRGWPLHLLGGSPQKQYRLAHERGWDVVSADGNYIQKQAGSAAFFHNGICRNAKNKYFPRLKEVRLGDINQNVPYICFDLSLINIRAMWDGCQAGIRLAHDGDFDAINRIARQWNIELGFVSRAMLAQSATARELYIAEKDDDVCGFVRWHRRRDGWNTVYEIAIDKARRGQGIGRALLDAVPRPVRLKCTVDNATANAFYAAQGMILARVEQGKRRRLNVWERSDHIADAVNMAA